MLSQNLNPLELKLAEKLTILNDRAVGVLTRTSNIKKICSEPRNRPSFLTDKQLEPAIKAIGRRFPVVETRGPGMPAVQTLRAEIVQGLRGYYYTFQDILEFKEHAIDLFNVVSSAQVSFDLALNFDLTHLFLDLVVNYASLMIILSRIDDRKSLMGLYNHAYEIQNGSGEPSFPRLGQMVIDYENPLKKLTEDFAPHSKQIAEALISLSPIYFRRNLSAEQMKQTGGDFFNLSRQPQKMLTPFESQTMPCEYLSLNDMTKWITIGFLLTSNRLSSPGAMDLWRAAMTDGYVVPLFRDEVVQIHHAFEIVMKGKKFGTELKEIHTQALNSCALMHRGRRQYLKESMAELHLLLGDQPGLLGPKALMVFMALSLARDEVLWLVRHFTNDPVPKPKSKLNPADFKDKGLPELLYYMQELRALVRKYSQVMQRYFVQYLSRFDVTSFRDAIQKISICSDDESELLTSFEQRMSALNVKQVENEDEFDLRGFRLDWVRFQAYTSTAKSSLGLKDHTDVACLMNTAVFHSKMVDNLEEVLFETSDLSTLCFYPKVLDESFNSCMQNSHDARFSIAFPLIACQFMDCTHQMCPEERIAQGERCLSAVNHFLDNMAILTKETLAEICEEQIKLNYQLLPVRGAELMLESVQKRKEKHQGKLQAPRKKPGEESVRRTIEDVTSLDANYALMTSLCMALNHVPVLTAWDHKFSPREYLVSHLEDLLAKKVTNLTKTSTNLHLGDVTKPSTVLCGLKAFMSVLKNIENYANVDLVRVFHSVLLQQTQPADANGQPTLTSIYSQCYIDYLLREVITSGNICYSAWRKSFVSRHTFQFKAEEFTDVPELCALVELIGSYGVGHLSAKMLGQVSSQVQELKKLVLNNKETLHSLRSSFDKPDVCADLIRRLRNSDEVLGRMTTIGCILAFRRLLSNALHSRLQKRIPYLLTSIEDFQKHFPNGQDRAIVDEMATAAGLPCDIDPILCRTLARHCTNSQEDFVTWCLLMVFIGVSLPNLAHQPQCTYRYMLEAHENNAHTLAIAINGVASALFSQCQLQASQISERMKEFLAIASSSLLKLGMETGEKEKEKDPKNRESVYLLLDLIVQESPFLTEDVLESCFPYALLRGAYHSVFKRHDVVKKKMVSEETQY
ncbi:nck-associated protein 1 homolog [Oscarella lobularis]|uniref:nck-associated protein 1 homolog n=1 Tax=Oscarella lobularis TaxID=121494 RepID=UPI00331419D8